MYKALVRSHLHYRDSIYHIPAENNQTNLGVSLTSLVETQLSELNTKLPYLLLVQGSNRSKLGWETLSELRWFMRILQIHKIKNNTTSSYLRDKLPPNRRLLYRCTNFVQTSTSSKVHIPSLIRPKTKSTFGVHDPLGLRYIFQLRVNLSPLRNHRKTP